MLITCISTFIIALIVVCYSIRKIIYISHKKRLFDEPSENRKIHINRTPNLGGVAIFATMWLASCFILPQPGITQVNYIAAAVLILFTLGLTDDLVGVNPIKKIFGQLVVALIITISVGLRFTSFYGFFGLNEIPVGISVPVSVLFILLIINAFNLIDGVNCLAGSIGLLACVIFSFYFWELKETGLLYISCAMCGCLVGFLFFNRTPAKIFMGDTGSLFLGFVISVFAIKCMELSHFSLIKEANPLIKTTPALIFGLLIIPIFDTLRVFSLRIAKKKSPFYADRNHIHHLLIDLKLSHLQSTAILLAITILSVIIALILRNSRMELTIICIISFTLISYRILSLIISKKIKRNQISETFPGTGSVTYLVRNTETLSAKEESVHEYHSL